jgi:hypothetical protein
MKNYDQKELQFHVQFDEKPNEAINYQVAVFDRNKQLVYQSQVSENYFSLPFSSEDARTKRIFLTPYNDQRKATLSLDKLEKGGNYEISIPREIPSEGPIVLNPIPNYIWCWWLFCNCHIRGRVFNYCGDKYQPVYKARVHICEVDPLYWYIYKLPDVEILKLRDDILAKAINWHLPDPPPDGVIRVNPAIKDLAATSGKAAMRTAAFKEDAAISKTATDLTLFLPQQNITSLYSNSSYLVKDYLLQNYKLLYPYWCWLYPWWLTCSEVAVVETDANGWFEADMWYLCCGDKPDLYFSVEYLINGVWTYVYNPGLHCGTHWDYTCNTEVDIYVNDQRIPCPNTPTIYGNKVVVTTLGNNINASRVAQSGADIGLAPDLWYGYSNTGPFSGSIEPHVMFGDALTGIGIKYYRWRYKAHADADIEANWHNMNQSVDRYYFHESPDSFLTYNLGPKAYQSGTMIPLTNPDLFEIQTENVPAPGINTWFTLNARTDTATAYLNTYPLNTFDINGHVTAFADGLYDLKLEFYDATGAQVNLSLLGTAVEVLDPTKTAAFTDPFVDAVPAPAANQLLDTSNNLLGFKMIIRVDNNPTHAVIHETTVGLHAAGPCGMIPYHHKNTALAHIAFEAFQKNDFAFFDFSITKGSSGHVHDVSGNVSNSPAVTVLDNGVASAEAYSYNGTTDQFDSDKHVSTLLGTCDEAAFAEVLNVYATATDGWNRIGYDSSDVKAFALVHNNNVNP